MQGSALAIVIILLVAAAVLITLLGVWWLPPLASNWGTVDTALVITLVITGIAFVLIHLFVAYTVVRYRKREGHRAEYLPEHKRLEWGLIAPTAVGIFILLAPGLFVYSRFLTPPEEAMLVEVVGEQWRWSYRFPGPDGVLGEADPQRISFENPFGIDPDDPYAQDDILILGNELHLPVGVPVKLQLRAKDVIHSFFVPHFRVKMDLVPGMVTHTWFTPTEVGRYEIACAEYCGIGHYIMRGVIVVEDEEAFKQWLAAQPTFGGDAPQEQR